MTHKAATYLKICLLCHNKHWERDWIEPKVLKVAFNCWFLQQTFRKKDVLKRSSVLDSYHDDVSKLHPATAGLGYWDGWDAMLVRQSLCCLANNFGFNAFISRNWIVGSVGWVEWSGFDIQLRPTKLKRRYNSLKWGLGCASLSSGDIFCNWTFPKYQLRTCSTFSAAIQLSDQSDKGRLRCWWRRRNDHFFAGRRQHKHWVCKMLRIILKPARATVTPHCLCTSPASPIHISLHFIIISSCKTSAVNTIVEGCVSCVHTGEPAEPLVRHLAFISSLYWTVRWQPKKTTTPNSKNAQALYMRHTQQMYFGSCNRHTRNIFHVVCSAATFSGQMQRSPTLS